MDHIFDCKKTSDGVYQNLSKRLDGKKVAKSNYEGHQALSNMLFKVKDECIREEYYSALTNSFPREQQNIDYLLEVARVGFIYYPGTNSTCPKIAVTASSRAVARDKIQRNKVNLEECFGVDVDFTPKSTKKERNVNGRNPFKSAQDIRPINRVYRPRNKRL